MGRWSEALGECGWLQPSPLAKGICLSPVTAACNAGLLPGCCCGAESVTACSPSCSTSPGKRWVCGSGWAILSTQTWMFAVCTLLTRSALGHAGAASHVPAPWCFGWGGSITCPGCAAKGPHGPPVGRVFCCGGITGWGLHPLSRKQQQRRAGGNCEQVVGTGSDF